MCWLEDNMGLGPRLEIKQSQSLTLTPQLMQSIKLLQLGHLELAAFVNQELERNPLLDKLDRNNEYANIEENAPLEQYDEQIEQVDFANTQTIGSASDIANNYDTDVANLFPEQVGQDSVSQSTASFADNYGVSNIEHNGAQAPDIDNYIARKPTLSEHLHSQVSLMALDSSELLIAHHLINSLDDRGYLDSSTKDIAILLGTLETEIIKVQKKLQACDPIGIFATDLSDCLAIQLRELDRLDPIMKKLLDNLHLVASHDFVTLAKTIGADKEDIDDMLQELRQLDPKPALAFDGAPTQMIIADVFVKEENNGANGISWKVELNSEILPRVLVNRTYYANVSKQLRQKQEKLFLIDCLQTANWLTKSLDQRAQTILKTATEIVRVQSGFLKHGISHLKPMTLKNVADAINMHESTISRVTANKYISTPRGLFEMKFFFTQSLASNINGEDHSAASVRHAIKKLIDDESAKAILSDDKLAQILRDNLGVDIARRTIAKYREAMNIPSSIIRRRMKKQQR